MSGNQPAVLLAAGAAGQQAPASPPSAGADSAACPSHQPNPRPQLQKGGGEGRGGRAGAEAAARAPVAGALHALLAALGRERFEPQEGACRRWRGARLGRDGTGGRPRLRACGGAAGRRRASRLLRVTPVSASARTPARPSAALPPPPPSAGAAAGGEVQGRAGGGAERAHRHAHLPAQVHRGRVDAGGRAGRRAAAGRRRAGLPWPPSPTPAVRLAGVPDAQRHARQAARRREAARAAPAAGGALPPRAQVDLRHRVLHV